MKFIPAQLAAFVRNKGARRNLRLLFRYLLLLLGVIAAYSVTFHYLMALEGQDHTWTTGVYWTLTVMSTLGFGDITFHSDIGRAFSVFVLMSGVVFLLIVFPFTFIQFFYAPWLETQEKMRAPRELPEDTEGHVILTGDDPIVHALATRLRALGRPHVVLVEDLPTALELFDEGIRVAVGGPDDGETWKRMRIAKASLVVVATNDFANSNITFTVREAHEDVTIVTLARSVDSVDVLELAGATHVVQLSELLGRSLARRAYGGGIRANVVGEIDGLVVAEAPATHSCLVGKTLAESGIRSETGATVLGCWQRGEFALPRADSVIENGTVLVLAGAPENLERFDDHSRASHPDLAPIVILGGGRVGRVVGSELADRGLDYRIVEQDEKRIRNDEHYVLGTAADLATLERAGIRETPTVVITTHDDAVNIYLTIYCRRLRPDLQIVARANQDRNVSTLHRAGADLVMSYSALGASIILGLADERSALHIAEGLEIFRHPVPSELFGRTIAESGIRERTQCTILSIHRANDERVLAPGPDVRLGSGDELLLAGGPDARQALRERFRG